jgi:hypothetical protein
VAESIPALPLPAQPRTRPTLLFALAIVGVVLGSFGAMSAITTAPLLLGSRDDMVQRYRESIAKTTPPLTPADQIELVAEREGDARYRRRNAQLPLLLIQLIVSGLLFAGCSRALRGQVWGAAAWSLAATVAIPYELLDTALTLVQAHDLEAAFITLPQPLRLTEIVWLNLQTLSWVLVGGLKILYFGACLIYLRLPSVRALFTAGAGRRPPSA